MAFVQVAQVGDIAPGTVKFVEVDDEGIAVCNVGGEFYAIADVCTHDDGPLGQGCLEGHQIECPRHGARFDVRTGAVTSLPAVVPVPTYPVKVEGDDLLVEI